MRAGRSWLASDAWLLREECNLEVGFSPQGDASWTGDEKAPKAA